MHLIYSLLLVVWGILLLPVFVYKAAFRGKTLPGLAERFGRLPDRLRPSRRGAIWFHACSVGETLSLEPLERLLRERCPDARFVFSTITKTGQETAAARFGPKNVFYFPVDFAWVVRRVLTWIHPAVIVIVDTEIWPNLLRQAKRRGIPVILINGRISPRSFPRYRIARPLWRRVFPDYEVLYMQSDEDASRILRLGAPKDKVVVTGNLKFDRDLSGDAAAPARLADIARSFALDASSAPLIVAGSTHSGEEQALFEALRGLRAMPGLQTVRLLVAPRHPERFDEVAELAERMGLRLLRRTHLAAQNNIAAQDCAAVLLLDTLGELAAVYHCADVVFVGGSLVPRGGHSILEPAAAGKAIVVGPHMENFRAIADRFSERGAVHILRAGEKEPELQQRLLLDVFIRLLQNAGERERMGTAARTLVEENRGAARAAADSVAACYERTTGSESRYAGS